LHWRLFWHSEPEDDFWSAAVDGEMSHVHQLLVACAPQREDSRLWEAAAALHLLVRDVPLDWAGLLEQAQKHHLLLPLYHTLSAVQAVDGSSVPPEVLARLEAHPFTGEEREVHHLQTQPPTVWHRLRLLWLIHTRLHGPASFTRQAARFPRFLKHRWRLARWRQSSPHTTGHAAEVPSTVPPGPGFSDG
jgi:hypothetical protein